MEPRTWLQTLSSQRFLSKPYGICSWLKDRRLRSSWSSHWAGCKFRAAPYPFSLLTRDSVCVVSILRVHSIYVLAHSEDDPIFYAAPPIYWAAIEMNLAIVCACIPALKPLVVTIIPAFASRRTGVSNTERSTSSKLSKISHNFQKIGGSTTSSRNLDKYVESGQRDTELDMVTALPHVHRPQANPGHITVTYDVDQRSNRRPSDGSIQRLVKL